MKAQRSSIGNQTLTIEPKRLNTEMPVIQYRSSTIDPQTVVTGYPGLDNNHKASGKSIRQPNLAKLSEKAG